MTILSFFLHISTTDLSYKIKVPNCYYSAPFKDKFRDFTNPFILFNIVSISNIWDSVYLSLVRSSYIKYLSNYS